MGSLEVAACTPSEKGDIWDAGDRDGVGEWWFYNDKIYLSAVAFWLSTGLAWRRQRKSWQQALRREFLSSGNKKSVNIVNQQLSNYHIHLYICFTDINVGLSSHSDLITKSLSLFYVFHLTEQIPKAWHFLDSNTTHTK